MNDKPIDKIKIGYDTWYVYKISKTSYKYMHWPDAMFLDMIYQITVTLNNEKYDFDMQECTDSDWKEWEYYEDKVKDTVEEDTKKRINQKPNKEMLFEID